MRLPLNRVGTLNKIGKTYSRLEQQYEREPTASELAEELDMSITEVAETIRISGRHLSVDAPFAQGKIIGFWMYCKMILNQIQIQD